MPAGSAAFELWYEWRQGRMSLDWLALPLLLWTTIRAIDYVYTACSLWNSEKPVRSLTEDEANMLRWLNAS